MWGTDKDEYHSWLEVYVKGQGWVNPDIFMDKDTWTIMDPTFASTKYDYEENTLKQHVIKEKNDEIDDE